MTFEIHASISYGKRKELTLKKDLFKVSYGKRKELTLKKDLFKSLKTLNFIQGDI